jgi:hypothetical protein
MANLKDRYQNGVKLLKELRFASQLNEDHQYFIDSLFEPCFKGKALIWYREKTSGDVTWNALVDAFKTKYLADKCKDASLRELMGCAQKADETGSQFATRL